MAGKPKPWWNNERNAWYVTINGKRDRLAEDKEEADKAFYALMLTEGEISQQRDQILVPEAVEALCESVQHHRASTRRPYVYNLGPFTKHFRSRRLDSITADEAMRFVAAYEGRNYNNRPFGDASRYLMFRYIKTLLRWARDVGLIQINPMHGEDGP